MSVSISTGVPAAGVVAALRSALAGTVTAAPDFDQTTSRVPAGPLNATPVRSPAATGEAVDQRGDEYGLTGPRQAGDAQPHRRVEEVLAVVDQRPGRQARLFDHILKTECHMNVIDLGRAEQ